MRILAFPERETPRDLRRQVLVWQEEAWPGGDGEDGWHDPALRPLTVLLVDDAGTVLSGLDVLSKEIHHGGQVFQASGLSRVVTGGVHRGRGHGRRLVAYARDAIRASGADLGLFTCDTELRGFYESAGWPVLPGAVLIGGTPDDPLPSDRFDKVTLAAFFSAHARRHAYAFPHTRIALHPGPVDRLW